MAKLNVPKEILQLDTFKSLPAKGKEEYLDNLLKKILELNPDGVTISQIKEAASFTYSTVWHHLEVLCATAQGRKISRGNLDLYYPCGKIIPLSSIEKGDVQYALSIVENNEGKFLCIHEKRQGNSKNYKVCRGVTMPIELLDEVVKAFEKLRK